jgi:Holliday junction resolvase RusA-like endonuclease
MANGKVYNPPAADAWKEEIKAAFLMCRKETITEPVYLKVCFYLPMPKGIKKSANECIRHAHKPDLDNLLKAVMDALTSVGIWKDDSLVFKVDSEKWYTPLNGSEGAQIIIEA